MKRQARDNVVQLASSKLTDAFAAACERKWGKEYARELVKTFDKWTNYADEVSEKALSHDNWLGGDTPSVAKTRTVQDALRSKQKTSVLRRSASRESPFDVNNGVGWDSTIVLAFYLPRDIEFDVSIYEMNISIYGAKRSVIARLPWKTDEHTDYTLSDILVMAKTIPLDEFHVADDPTYSRVQWVFPFMRMDNFEIEIRPTNTDETVTIFMEVARWASPVVECSFMNDPWVASWVRWGPDGVTWATETSTPGSRGRTCFVWSREEAMVAALFSATKIDDLDRKVTRALSRDEPSIKANMFGIIGDDYRANWYDE